MRKCCGNNWEEWGAEAIFDLECPHCGQMVEFFKDEITRTCPSCKQTVKNRSNDYGCGQWCSRDSSHRRNICPKFKRSKHRFYHGGMPQHIY